MPPTITDVAISDRSSTSVTITWTTSEPSSSLVEYGLGAAYGISSGINSTPVAIHRVRITGLAPDAVYHFRVRSTRENGLAAVSNDLTFSTDVVPPRLAAIGTSNISTSSVTISWMTSKPTYGRIDYLSASASKQTAYDSTLGTSHSITLTGLVPGTTYSYLITSTDSATNVVLSEWNTVQTAVLSLPTALGSSPTAGAPGVMTTQGRYAYVASSEAPYNFQVYDVGGTGAPALKATIATGSNYPTSIAVSGNYVYITSVYNGGLLIYDVGNPSAPKLVSKTDVGYHPYGISIQGSYAYISHYTSTTAESTLAIYDISNPLKPVRAGVTPISLLSKSVVVEGRYAYVIGDGSPNFQVFDVANPNAPVRVGTLAAESSQKALVIRGQYAYITYAASGGGLQIIDISDPAKPVAVAKLATGTNPMAVLLDGQYAYLIGDAMRVIDISNPVKPYLVGSSPVGGLGLSLQGRQLYSIDPNTRTINAFGLGEVSNPAPVSVTSISARMIIIPSAAPLVVTPTASGSSPAAHAQNVVTTQARASKVPSNPQVNHVAGTGSNSPTPIVDQLAQIALGSRGRRLKPAKVLRPAARQRRLGEGQHCIPVRLRATAEGIVRGHEPHG